MLIPATRYQDPEAALAFLKEVFGLKEHALHRSDDGRIVHVQMRVGAGLMMFGPPTDGTLENHMADPSEFGGRATMTIYAVVSDLEARYRHVVERGAKILLPLEAQDYGGQAFTASDCEGHIWTFGDYDPLAG